MASGFVLQPSNVAEDRKAEFTAVQAAPGAEEHYSGSTLLVVAYLAIWVILMAWILVLWRRQASIGARLEGLEAAIDRAVLAREGARQDPSQPSRLSPRSDGAGTAAPGAASSGRARSETSET